MKTRRLIRFLAGLALALSVPAPARGTLPFLKDDYAGAIAQARSRSVPLFVEAWAPW